MLAPRLFFFFPKPPLYPVLCNPALIECCYPKQALRRLRSFWRGVYDVRPGDGLRTLFMALHMVCVLFAYYILKPVSRALFLNKFDIDQLPYLYVLIAIVGGCLAYVYTRVAVRSSLAVAVNWATIVAVASLIAIWWLLRFNFNWMLYVFNIWVSLFS